ncbi:MAG: MarR family transcriptional regulator [Vallitaleaceae bacterium]|nr:MarR family transcriptional regulator [Vallitaleaceae bacterium]
MDAWVRQSRENIQHLFQHYKNLDIDMPLHSPLEKKLNPTDMDVLNLFELETSIAIKKVIMYLDVPNSTITSTVNRLEAKGLITRSIHPQDKRTYNLQLTENGQEIINLRKARKEQFLEILFQVLDDEEKQTLFQLLSKMTEEVLKNQSGLARRFNMNKLEQEYHSFGSWLVEIKDEEDIPVQFIDLKQTILDAEYSFKVPRKIERRKAHPGMRLYDAVVSLLKEKIVLQQFHNKAVEVHEIPFHEITYLVHSNELLDSQIIIVTKKQEYVIGYNSVSFDISNDFISRVRDRILTPVAVLDLDAFDEVKSIDSELYKNLISNETSDSPVKIIEYQPFIELSKTNPSTAEKLFNALNKYELQDTVFLANTKELIIVNRKDAVKKVEKADYGYCRTYMDLTKIKSIRLKDAPEMSHLQILLINMDDIEVPFEVGDTFTMDALNQLLTMRKMT